MVRPMGFEPISSGWQPEIIPDYTTAAILAGGGQNRTPGLSAPPAFKAGSTSPVESPPT